MGWLLPVELTMSAYATPKVGGPPIAIGDMQSVKIVAKVLSENDFTAKQGPADLPDDEIIANGDPVPPNVARWLFHAIAQRCRCYVR